MCSKVWRLASPPLPSSVALLYSCPVLTKFAIETVKLLFNLICEHGFVPDNFGYSVNVLVMKDRLGDICSTDNCRPVILSPVLSKVFEYCILHKYESLFISDELQFGFKKNTSCSRALFVLTQVMEYFTSHGSNVYIAFLDATKAFDHVHRIKLFEKLIEAGLPGGGIVKVIFDWYSKTFATVKWNNHYSSFMQVRSGIRQGGIFSPFI